MSTVVRLPAARKPIWFLAVSTLAAGGGGMVMSYLYLASMHHLDVIAGAAGFVAGSIFIASGLISISLLSRAPLTAGLIAQEPVEAEPILPASAVHRWLAHFWRNQARRPEPDWNAPLTLAPDVVRPLVHSLEQFELADGGGPAYLIAWNRERFLTGCDGMRTLVDLWFKEEREHSRLLGEAVSRFGGRKIEGHWSFTTFCLTRKWLGVRFELTILLLTEIAATVYYKLLWRHGEDPALRSMCRLILRDESGHVAFHRDRLAHAGRTGQATYGKLWEGVFRLLGLAAGTMLWVNHAAGLRAIGATRAEFYREICREMTRFTRRLRRDAKALCGL